MEEDKTSFVEAFGISLQQYKSSMAMEDMPIYVKWYN